MVSRIIYSAYAKQNLREIFDYISNDSKLYASRQILKIKFKIKFLKNNPKIGQIVPEIGIEHIREIIEGNYRIIYMLISEYQIDILTIHHTSRKLNITHFL